MEFSARDGFCRVCVKIVTARQHALECDGCRRWVHRLCGTGITYTQYRGIMDNIRHGGTFPWRCQACVKEARPSRATCVPKSACDDAQTDSVDLDVGVPAFESTRLDTTFKYVLKFLNQCIAKSLSQLWPPANRMHPLITAAIKPSPLISFNSYPSSESNDIFTFLSKTAPALHVNLHCSRNECTFA